MPSLEKEIQDANKFKEFYQFTFNYAKNAGQKGLDLDMALAYWNIVLKGKFRFLDVWTKFLKVNISLNYQIKYRKITFFLLIMAKVDRTIFFRNNMKCPYLRTERCFQDRKITFYTNYGKS